MVHRHLLRVLLVAGAVALLSILGGRAAKAQNWDDYYHYPYNYFQGGYSASDYQALYPPYWPPEYPYYNKYPFYERIYPQVRPDYYNYYPRVLKYHSGYHFILDVF